MSTTRKPPRLQSWIPPGFAWTSPAEVFWLDVPITDPDVVAFIATGVCDISVTSSKAAYSVAKLLGQRLRALLAATGQLKSAGIQAKSGASIQVHCHGVFLQPGEKTLLVMVGGHAPSVPDGWISKELRAQALQLHGEHQIRVAEFDKETERQKQEHEKFCNLHPELKKFNGMFDAQMGMREVNQRPVVMAESLVTHLPRAASFPLRMAANSDRVARAATAAINASNWAPSRDGTYDGILGVALGRKRQGVVTWNPYCGLPAYPEVRWSVQRRLPRALCNPRATQPGRPEFESGLRSMGDNNSIGITADTTDLIEAIDNLHFDDDTDLGHRVDEVRSDIKDHGFEAIAWFQPYHSWTENTWGIYFDAIKLDNLALSLLDDFKTHRVQGSHSLAALLAFGLTYAHEMFHAKVEAALSWMEVNALQSRHLRYKQRIYDALRETPDWLEEALANWSAWDWFQSEAAQAASARGTTSPDGLQHVVETALDMSPPGYQDWRVGHLPVTWRSFATQLATGKPNPPPGICLPIESTLTGPLPYDFRATDIPLRFVGRGAIADRLQSHPATFNVPARRELEKALKYFKHMVDPSDGKGSHQKWTGPDQRAFILPTRDPVSMGVFKTFLHHMGIDKATYVREVRPNL